MSRIFARNLKTYRTIARMTQTDLAKAAGITRAVVNNYELARSEPSFENLCKIAVVLGVEITDLVEDKGGNELSYINACRRPGSNRGATEKFTPCYDYITGKE